MRLREKRPRGLGAILRDGGALQRRIKGLKDGTIIAFRVVKELVPRGHMLVGMQCVADAEGAIVASSVIGTIVPKSETLSEFYDRIKTNFAAETLSDPALAKINPQTSTLGTYQTAKWNEGALDVAVNGSKALSAFPVRVAEGAVVLLRLEDRHAASEELKPVIEQASESRKKSKTNSLMPQGRKESMLTIGFTKRRVTPKEERSGNDKTSNSKDVKDADDFWAGAKEANFDDLIKVGGFDHVDWKCDGERSANENAKAHPFVAVQSPAEPLGGYPTPYVSPHAEDARSKTTSVDKVPFGGLPSCDTPSPVRVHKVSNIPFGGQPLL